MTAATPTLGAATEPVENALAAVRRRRGPEATRGIAPGLIVPAGATEGTAEAGGWVPAAALVAGGGPLDDLLDAAKQRWRASPHAAAALAWRSYTYWLAMPVVLGWGTARRVPLLDPDDVLVRLDGDQQLLTLGLRRLKLAVLASDPLADAAAAGTAATGSVPGLTVVDDEQALLAVLRSTLRDRHLDPLLAAVQTRVNLGTRTLLGSLASAVAYGVVRGLPAPRAEQTATADALLGALDLADLVELEQGPDGPLVRRRTCCLAFTLPEPKVCSGCCLRP